MSFRLVPKSMTLNGLERRNGRYFCRILQNSAAFGANCVKVVEDSPILLRQKCGPNCLVFSNVRVMAIFA